MESKNNDTASLALAEMTQLKSDLDKALGMRQTLLGKIRENPSEELTLLLAELDDAIESGKRRLSSMWAAEIRQQFIEIGRFLTEKIEEFDDEEFLKLGDEAEPCKFLQDYENQREAMVGALAVLHEDDLPAELLTRFDNTIAAAHRQIIEKRLRAEERFPHLKQPPKEYEMDESYKKALAFLLEAIEQRDELAEMLKDAPPEKKSEGLTLLALMDKKIEEGEQALANEYEAFQNHARVQESLRAMLKSKSPFELDQLREHLRKNPGTMSEVEKMLAEEFGEAKGH